jgi:hypothetical protein
MNILQDLGRYSAFQSVARGFGESFDAKSAKKRRGSPRIQGKRKRLRATQPWF